MFTGKPVNLKITELMKRIWTKRYEVLHGGTPIGIDGPNTASAVKSVMADKSVDLTSIPPEWVVQIERRLKYIKGLQAAHVTRGQRKRVAAAVATTAQRLSDPKPPSPSAVMEWARKYQTSDCNPMALLDLNQVARRPRRLPLLVEETISSTLRAEYFTKKRHTLRHAHDCVRLALRKLVKSGAIEERHTDVSYTTLQRRVADTDRYRRISLREGEGRARMACRTSMDGGVADYPLQRVELDHTILNWVVVCDRTGLPLGRPVLTVAIDAHSGYIVGFYLSFYGPGVTSVTGVLKNSFLPKDDLIRGFDLKNPWLSHGLADEWVLDNGMEFHSKIFKAICWELKIDMTYCRVRTPWLKPHVERFFADLNWLTLARGRVDKVVANVVRMDPYKDACITFSDLVRGLTQFIVDVHPFQINERKIARPFDLFMEGMERCPPANFPVDPEKLRLISGMSKQLTIDQGGTNLVGLPYGGAELKPLRDRYGKSFKTECRWDPDDMSKLFVRDPDERTVWLESPCRWTSYASDLSWNQHRLIRSFNRKALKAKDAEEYLLQARMRLHEMWLDVTRPKRRKESLMAGRASGETSTRHFAGQPVQGPPATASRIVVAEDAAEMCLVTELEAFDLE